MQTLIEEEFQIEELISTMNDMINDKFKGLYVVVEGIDGSGKSTLCENLAQYISSEYIVDVDMTYEFTSGKIGQYIRKHLNDDTFNNEEVQLLALFDRLHHITKLDGISQKIHDIPPRIVICDRGWMSTLAYALAQNDNDINCERMQILFEITELISLTSETPNLTIFVDVPVDTALDRIEKRNDQRDRFENRNTLVKVDEAYHQLIHYMKLGSNNSEYTDITRNFITVDGSTSQMAVVIEAVNKMEELGLLDRYPKGE